MKILKIEDGIGCFSVPPSQEWRPIDEINKEDLMQLLNVFLENDVEMDSTEDHQLSNPAQLIVYQSIYAKFKTLEENKGKFRDEADRQYLSAIQKYSAA